MATASDNKLSIDRLVTVEELAKRLGKSVRTLNRWHTLRTGPKRFKLGGRTSYYHLDDVIRWIDDQRETQR